jgi:hypothetical protein
VVFAIIVASVLALGVGVWALTSIFDAEPGTRPGGTVPTDTPSAVDTPTPNSTPSSSPSPSVTDDPEAVGAPEDLHTTSPPTFSSVVIAWSRPRGDDAARIFQILRDGRLLDRVETRSYRDTTVDPGMRYEYVVVAVGAGRTTAESEPLTVQVPVSPTPAPTESGGGGGGSGQVGGADGQCSAYEALNDLNGC